MPSNQLLTKLLRERLEEYPPGERQIWARVLVDNALQQAREGSAEITKLIWDRSDGKLANKIEGLHIVATPDQLVESKRRLLAIQEEQRTELGLPEAEELELIPAEASTIEAELVRESEE